MNNMYDITCSLVCYKNDRKQLLAVVNSFLNTNLKVKIYLVDNSPTSDLKDLKKDSRLEYIHNPTNPGFGAAHNIVFKKIMQTTNYHLVINPDIYYEKGVIESILTFMDAEQNVGLVMPKILYPKGNIQYLAKLLPTPFDFFIRRLMPIKKIRESLNNKFELRFSGYNKIMDAPYLSGCFMVFKVELLEIIKGFDENIFLYIEDADITRRSIDAGYRTVFHPHVSVYHDHEIKATTNIKAMLIYLKSAIYYFNKWGWFFDKKRKTINNETINKILHQKQSI